MTEGPAREAVNEPPLTGTAGWEVRSAFADVNQGVQEAGTVPPAMPIGTDRVEVPQLIATTTTLFDDLHRLLAAPRGRRVVMHELHGPLGLAVWMSDVGRLELRPDLFVPRQRTLAMLVIVELSALARAAGLLRGVRARRETTRTTCA